MNICILLILSLAGPCDTLPENINEFRSLYKQAVASKEICIDFIQQLNTYPEEKYPVLAGYKAGAWMIMAKHVLNPVTKLSHFNKGKKMLENMINKNNNSIELRYIRFGIQSQSPSFLGYRSKLDEDKRFLISRLPELQDSELKKEIHQYLENTKTD